MGSNRNAERRELISSNILEVTLTELKSVSEFGPGKEKIK